MQSNRGNTFVRFYVVGITCLVLFTSLLQLLDTLIRNRFYCYGLPRARIIRVGYAVCIQVFSPVPLTIYAGQFLNLYIPGISLGSILQSHPFVVTAIQSEKRGMRLEFMVKPEQGWTSKLLQQARAESSTDCQVYVAFFSGPHDRPVPIDGYGVVVLTVSGWGIFAQIPYLQHLIHAYNNTTTKARRVHLIWQLENIGRGWQYAILN